MKRKRPSKKFPSKKRISDGIYIDVEGFAGNEFRTHPPPVLVGIFNWHRSKEFQQVVFTADYRWAAENPGVNHAVTYDPNRNKSLEKIVASSTMSKPLFAYSEHEQRILRNELGLNVTKRYKNVRSISKAWFNRHSCDITGPESGTLVDLAKTLGLDVNAKLEKGGITDRLRSVRNYSKSKKHWRTAPKSVKDKWTEVLEHNRLDVLLMREVMLKLHELTKN